MSLLLAAGAAAWQLQRPFCAVPRAHVPRSAVAMELDSFVLERLSSVRAQFEELSSKQEQPEVQSNVEELLQVTRERAKLEPTVNALEEYEAAETALAEAKELFGESGDDEEMREMAREEIKAAEETMAELDERIKILLLPKDPNDDKDIMLEVRAFLRHPLPARPVANLCQSRTRTISQVRAGTGGDEAALFCGDLIKLYTKYAESQGWTVRLASASESETGGFRDATLEVKGDSVYSKLKFEAGVHRVQRVPATETQGRVHTSTATVAIMPEVDEVAVEIDMKDIDLSTAR